MRLSYPYWRQTKKITNWIIDNQKFKNKKIAIKKWEPNLIKKLNKIKQWGTKLKNKINQEND
jgi:hypothetical protein